MGIKCLAKEHSTLTPPSLISGPLDTDSSEGLWSSQSVERPYLNSHFPNFMVVNLQRG